MDMQFLLCLIVTWYGKAHRIVTDLGILIWIQKIRTCLHVGHYLETKLNRCPFSSSRPTERLGFAEQSRQSFFERCRRLSEFIKLLF